ncbi:MAG: sigma-54 dependent transcriptional regulator [Gammaproteobacteria bacterium]|nr:sigma-54 dependent transcriptional regulator [Gammaproteobacteria bacterium]MBT8150063.1 sigma-54 dependent transcriptional regulator [Gammaproteobacteria bacterium]NND39906.1 sigma-54-dependent Fis family transcriptional regulator [Pseudomonadales bacterium]NNM12446.1 sigma-54-dependent Fis family transcriptional regulator [Pseudomonadales bacterium]RZV49244.1 MAG: sigma-54-dependent Fis family transcriptional regulator [Pseudomonadales bacterium]
MTVAPEYCSLVVDEDAAHSQVLENILRDVGLNPMLCSTLADAHRFLDNVGDKLLAAFIALDLPDGEGLELLQHQSLEDADVALMHHCDDPVRARRGIKLNASYFFCKPLDQPFIANLLQDIREERLSAAASAERHAHDHVVDQFGLLRGSSKKMRKLYRMLRKVAPSNASVLLVGESGTGKELAAQTIHELSAVEGPFVAMNCGAIPAELAESELFGHEKGAFSGAQNQHAGFFERADGGTLLLDEIGEMDMDLQVKLLRVLESRRFRRVGGEKELEMTARIVAATNRDPQEAIAEGLLREDLYFRIAQFPLNIPPLRDRGDDALGLALHFLHELNLEHGVEKALAPAAIEAIQKYPWPGNVRELRSAVQRAHIMASSKIEAEHFPEAQAAADVDDGDYLTVSVGASLEDAERKLIYATLEATEGNKTAAAEKLGISLKTLYNRLKEYES